MSYSFLPKGDVPGPKKIGNWEHISQLINRLSENLEVQDIGSRGVSGTIPTVWARPILFSQALTDENHPSHKEVLGEWRGLLGLFCFKDSYPWDISSESHNIRKNSSKQFERTLDTLIPKDNWRKIHLIYVEDTLIGATSPLSFFFTPAEYKCPNSIPWKKSGRLTDPTEYFSSYNQDHETELYVLKEWIDKTAVEIAANSNLDEDTKDKLLRVFNEWSDEVGGEIEKIKSGLSKPTVTLNIDHPVVNDDPYKIVTYSSCYQKPEKSDFLLDCRIKKNPPIVIVKKLWDGGGLVYPPYRTSNFSFKNFPHRVEGKAREIFHRIEYEGKYLRPELLFTKKILKLSLSKHNVITNNNEYVFPLRKEILHFFEPEDIRGLVEWEDKGKSVKVTLRLPLKTEPKSYGTVSRFYSADDIIQPDPTPPLDIWPNFRVDDWQYYYGQYYYEKAPFSCKFYPKSEESRKHSITWIWRMKEFPKVVICNDLRENPIGLIPIKQPIKLDIVDPSRWFVAVDFGTSNTSVFYRTSLDDRASLPERLVFEERCLKLTNPDEKTRDEVLLSSFFPPSGSEFERKIKGIFPSHLRTFQSTSLGDPEPMVDGCILFVEPFELEILGGFKNYIRTNLKWSRDPSERKLILIFLKQVLLMIMAEARTKGVKKIELRCSYPSSFSIQMKKDFSRFWSIVSRMGASSGFQIDVSFLETESACVCKYLAKDPESPYEATPEAPNQPQIIVDIGGGTTDIGVWMEGGLQVQTSLLLGGNIISDIYVRQKDEFRKKIEEIINRELPGDLFKQCPSAVMNVLLGDEEYSEKINNSIGTTETHTPEIKSARTIIALVASGIFYYIGMLIRQLASQGKDVEGCELYLAGNGARLLSWVFSEEDYELLYSTFRCGAGANLEGKDVKIFPPKNHKEEVARGLLYNYDLERFRSIKIILGEEGYTYEGEQLSWDFNIYDHIERLRTMRPSNEFPEVKKFIGVFNSQADILSIDKIDLNPKRMKTRIEQSFREKYERQEVKEEEILVEPPFVEEIKAILTEKYHLRFPY